MPLPSGTIPLVQVAAPPPPAFLVRFPEDTWTKLGAAARAGEQVSFTVGDDGLTLNIDGHEPIALDNLPGQASELYESTHGSLAPLGVATSRLSVPFSAATTSRAAEKVRQTNELLDRERQARAGRVTGKPAPPQPVAASVKPLSTGGASLSNKPMSSGPSYPAVHAIAKAQPMARAMSGPAATLTMATTERIPLKTRIVQLLALGPLSLADILARTGGNRGDVERAAKVIGQQQPGGTFRLRPPQYAKIKIGHWKYTYDEKVTVIKLARIAFDELALAPDSEERAELEQKAREALEMPSHGGGVSSSGSNPTTPPEEQPTAAPPPKAKSASPVKASSPLPPPERNDSPAPSASAPKKSAAAAKADKDRTKVGKQIAKMRSDFAKRASSLPNAKSADGTASPRMPLGADGNDSDVPERRPDRSPEKKQKEKEPKEKPKPEKEKETKTAKASKSSEPSKSEKEKEREKPRSTAADKDKDTNGKRKRETGSGGSSSNQRGAAARDYTSSESSDGEDDRGRGRTRKVKPTTNGKAAGKPNGTNSSNGNGAASKRRGSPVYTSSEDEAPLKRRRDDKERDRPSKSARERERGERDKDRDKDRDKERLRNRDKDKGTDDAAASSLPSFKRKQPAPLEINGHKRTSSGVSASAPLSPASPALATTPKYLPKGAPDAKALRQRWDDIYPRYQKLAESLSGVYQAAERVRDGGSPESEDAGMGADDVSAKAAQWAEWHKELEGIKQWFAA